MKRSGKPNWLLQCFICLLSLLTFSPSLHAEEDWPRLRMGQHVYSLLLFDQLEYRGNDGPDTFTWDAQGWIGGDGNKIWFKTEGAQELNSDRDGETEVQLLYSRLVSSFWDFQVGLRYDQLYGPGSDPWRLFTVLGFEGLAPYWFDVEPALFISEDGDVSARLTGTYDLLLTQRLIAQPRFELNVAAQEVEEFGIGEGVNDIELGLRLRYEIWREFAPYIGVSWLRQVGDTADIARREGEVVDNLTFVVGIRLWF
jgi:copper resistance protein B